jgi:hypothetical protein
VDKNAAASKKVDSQYTRTSGLPVAAGADRNFGGAGAGMVFVQNMDFRVASKLNFAGGGIPLSDGGKLALLGNQL